MDVVTSSVVQYRTRLSFVVCVRISYVSIASVIHPVQSHVLLCWPCFLNCLGWQSRLAMTTAGWSYGNGTATSRQRRGGGTVAARRRHGDGTAMARRWHGDGTAQWTLRRHNKFMCHREAPSCSQHYQPSKEFLPYRHCDKTPRAWLGCILCHALNPSDKLSTRDSSG